MELADSKFSKFKLRFSLNVCGGSGNILCFKEEVAGGSGKLNIMTKKYLV